MWENAVRYSPIFYAIRCFYCFLPKKIQWASIAQRVVMALSIKTVLDLEDDVAHVKWGGTETTTTATTVCQSALFRIIC